MADFQTKATFVYLAFFVTLTLTSASNDNATCQTVPENERLDCLPEKNLTDRDCLARKCCWLRTSNSLVPTCFYGPKYPGYIVSDIQQTASGMKATLRRQGSSGFPKDIAELAMDVEYLNKNILRVKIYDKNSKRFEPPVPEREEISLKGSPNYRVFVSNDSGSFRVIRAETRETIFDTNVSGFIFSDQFIQISSSLPSKYIYGLGEHNERLLLNTTWRKYTLFNRGELVSRNPQFNMYGTHPFYLSIEKSRKTHGVFLLNSNAMDIILQPGPTITYRVIGGVLDFYFFLGPTPDEVISQYTLIIGKPTFPPYWSLGFHLSRYQYNSTNKTREVWKRNVDAGIPFDTQWSDIDYMEDHKIFTYDRTAFADLRILVEDIHNAGMYYVPITDPGLSGMEGPGKYPPFDQAKEGDLLIRDHEGEILTARVWQNVTVFVDFSHPNASEYWYRQFQDFYNQIPYDGAWIDMNEPYSFESGSYSGCPRNNTLEYPPYTPGNDPLFHGTICLSSQQYLSTHYDLHNLYGFMEGIATNKAMTRILKKRSFVLSRSTFSGYGHYGAHWTGDVQSDWSYMKDSIPNILNFNLFGIPMVGADICGFVGNTTEELCTRWSQLGAFYSFSRNHNDYDTIEQDPVAFGPDMVNRVTKVLKTRYSLLPFLYTLFFHSHVSGTPVLRPVFFDHLNDESTFDIDEQFLWGQALMILPVLEPGTTTVTAYFPRGIWYDFYTGRQNKSTGQSFSLNAPIDTINLVVKGGCIIPLQEPERTTTESRRKPFQLLVALDNQSEAEGDLFWDDGHSLDSVEDEKFNYIQFRANGTELLTTPQKINYNAPMDLSKVTIYGVLNAPTQVIANDQVIKSYSYDDTLKTLTINLEDMRTSLLAPSTFSWT